MSDAVFERKRALRMALRAQRRSVCPTLRVEAELRIQQAALKVAGRPRRVALYRAFDGEVSTRLLASAFRDDGVEVVFSRMSREKGLRFIAPESWRISALGLPIPQGAEVNLDEDDVIIAPLVGFDRVGNRLGMGGGCYDRAFGWCSARSIGLAFEIQRVEGLDVQATDRPLDMVCTEQTTYNFDVLEHIS